MRYFNSDFFIVSSVQPQGSWARVVGRAHFSIDIDIDVQSSDVAAAFAVVQTAVDTCSPFPHLKTWLHPGAIY